MENGCLRANVIEAKINDVAVVLQEAIAADVDDDNPPLYKLGKVVDSARIIESSGFKKGEHYQINDGYDAMNNVYACGLLEDINIEPQQDMMDPSKINVIIKVEELEPKSMKMDLDWVFKSAKGIIPSISRQALIPGGSVEISHANLFGDSQSLTCSLSSSDWRSPAQDLGFQFSFTEPFYKPYTTRNAQVPPVMVDRFGVKAWTSHAGGQDNKVEQNIILQQISMVDENGEERDG
eukprot:gene24402-10007_t